MARPLLAHSALVLALVASAGCGEPSRTDTTSTPPPIPATPTVYLWNNTAAYQFDQWAAQSLPGGPEVFQVGRHVNAQATVMPVTLAVADLDTGQLEEGPTGTRVGTPSGTFAAQGAGVGYLAFDAMPPGGSNALLEGWITWAIYEDGAWDMEEAPARWELRDLRGLAFFDGAPRVLLRSLHAYELWTLDGEWTFELIPDLSPHFGWAAMAANGTTLIIAGFDRAGQPTVWERGAGETAFFRAYSIGGSAGFGAGGFFDVAAPAEGRPVVAWGGTALVAGFQDLSTYLATRSPTGWAWEPEVLPDSLLVSVVATSNATFLSTDALSGEDQYHRWDGARWQPCQFEQRNRHRLLTIGDHAFLGYTAPFGVVGLARLTMATPSCLVGMASLPGSPGA